MTKILIAADYYPRRRVAEEIEKGHYDVVFGKIKPIEADYKIVNFECAVASDDDTPIKKCGPNLKCSPKGVEALAYAGFDCATLANNHFFDYGQSGVEKTIAQLKAHNMDYVGGGLDLKEAQETLYKTIGDETFAFVNCCEHEFSIATEQSGGSNPLNPVAQWYAIIEAKQKADHVIVIVHGGPELYNLPTPRMVETYRFFIDAGADAVINHHQHCFSGYVEYKGKPIFYGLGNFCFDSFSDEYSSWKKGYMVLLSFKADALSYKLIPYCQCYKEPVVRPFENDTELDEFNEKIKSLNEVICNPELLKERYMAYMGKSRRYYLSVLEPYNSRIMCALYSRGLLPSFLREKRKLHLWDLLSCESHQEKMLHALK
jgi:poly-gamma-glutamate synthesis protein (capsule biosynthesis protein)